MALGIARHARAAAHLEWWPVGTDVRPDDIVIAGTSLRHLAQVWGTPAIHSGESVDALTGGASTTGERTGVLVVRVIALAEHSTGPRIVQVDARLDNLRLIWSEARRVGGQSARRTHRVLVVRKPSTDDLVDTEDVLAITLPADLGVGDLLAIPSRPLPVDAGRSRHPLTGRPDGTPEPIFAATGANHDLS
ncbi:MAG TPA: hypothetical protein VHZ81_00620 [Galbitalea sp.]|jgi:hypothetical protein|nr:hypothetical protein [Galbitalea sp.]